MNCQIHIVLMLAASAMLLPIASGADEAPRLSGNPFARPPSAVSATRSVRNPGRDGIVIALDLRATLVASENWLANVGGQVIQPGDEVQGYRLLEVHEDHAIFLRDEKRLMVFVRPQRVDEND